MKPSAAPQQQKMSCNTGQGNKKKRPRGLEAVAVAGKAGGGRRAAAEDGRRSNV